MDLSTSIEQIPDDDGPWQVPAGWVWTKLGCVMPISYGKALPEKERASDGPVPVFGSSGQVGRHSTAIAPSHCVLVGRKGSAGAVHFSNEPSWPIDTAYFTAGTAAIDIRYGYWFLKFCQLGKLDQSTAIPSLSRDIYDVQPVPLAPLAEQRRIVARIDALFAEIAEGEAALAEARKGLETFRRALLKAAATGELTRDWRASNAVKETGEDLLQRLKDGNAEHAPSKRRADRSSNPRSELPRLPAGWAWASVEDVGSIQLGRQRAPQHHSGDHMRPYLRVANVFEDKIDLSDVKEMNFTPSEFETFRLRDGDVLLNEGQTPDLLGRPAIWRNQLDGCCFQNTLIRFRAREPITPEWALLVFRAQLHMKRFKRESQITTNIAHLSAGRFAKIEFPIPPLEEAAEILRRVSEAFEASADAAALLDAEAADASRLKQSILKTAFQGRLVPQDSKEEPASVLLARMNADQSEHKAKRGLRKAARAKDLAT